MSGDSTRDSVKRFYDTYGWQKSEDRERYLGEILHEDLDEVTQRYMDESELRYRAWLPGGRLFLDAGCGAKPRVMFSRDFTRHVCVDVSLLGLQEARGKTGPKGLQVVADLAALPFRAQAFDGVLASHCLYHIDRDLQPAVLGELYRVARPGRNILVFYASNHNLVSLVHAGRRLLRGAARLLRRPGRRRNASGQSPSPALYYYTHNPAQLTRGFEAVDLTCLRTLTRVETELLRRWRLLPPMVALASFLERSFPHGMRYVGKYVTIRIQRAG
jgi:ubiquinone/menaquinone biosynthesis C-methylase UbiE